jgi:hypothetical protein
MACLKSFDALAKNFVRVAYSVTHKGGKKCVDNEGGSMGGDTQVHKGCTHDMCKFNYYCDCSS